MAHRLKSKTYDWGGITLIVNDLKIASKPGQYGASTTTTLTATELGYLDGITAGTAIASKAMITDSNNDIAGLRKLTIRGPVGTGATGAGLITLETAELTVVAADQIGRIDFLAALETGADALTVCASITAVAAAAFSATGNDTDLAFLLGVSEVASEKMRLGSDSRLTLGRDAFAGTLEIMPATTASGQLQITCADQAADHSVIWNQASTSATRTVTMRDPGAAANFVMSTGTSTATAATSVELDFVAGVTLGTGLASKALTVDANGDLVMPAAGIIAGHAKKIITTGTTTNLEAVDSGALVVFNSAAASAVTLPAASIGLYYTFQIEATCHASTTITVDGSDDLVGGFQLTPTDTDAIPSIFSSDETDTILTINGTTTGGEEGSYFTMTCTAAGDWLCSGQLYGSGSLATMFS